MTEYILTITTRTSNILHGHVVRYKQKSLSGYYLGPLMVHDSIRQKAPAGLPCYCADDVFHDEHAHRAWQAHKPGCLCTSLHDWFGLHYNTLLISEHSWHTADATSDTSRAVTLLVADKA